MFMNPHDIYKSNSHKSKAETKAVKDPAEKEKKVEKIVKGNVKVKKKSGASKLANNIVSEDVSKVGGYVFTEILIPSIKKLITDVVKDGIDIILYGESRGNRSSSSRAGSVSYRSMYDNDRKNDNRYSNGGRSYNTYSVDDIVLSSQNEAKDVLSRMDELLADYGTVRVADLYDLVGVSGDWTANNYGWNNLRDAGWRRVRDGYLLELPRPKPLN